MNDSVSVKQTWAKPTGPHPEGRPVFSVAGKRISISEAKGLIDTGAYEPSKELSAWFAVYYKPKVTIELSIIETQKIADLKKRKEGIDMLVASSGDFYDEQLQHDIQDAQVEYLGRYNALMDGISKKVFKELGVELK